MRRLDPDALIDFERRLAEARVWCALKVKRSEKYASTSLPSRPAAVETGRYWSTELDPKLVTFPAMEFEKLRKAVARVSDKRRELLAVAPFGENSSNREPNGGLLGWRYGMCLFDTAPKWSSNGFFDDADMPPWDTWIDCVWDSDGSIPDYQRGALICWVPATWRAVADAGIEASPTATNEWLDNMRNDLSDQLKNRGLLS